MSVLLAALALPWLAAGAVAYVLLWAFRSAGRAGKFILGRIRAARAGKVPEHVLGPSDAASGLETSGIAIVGKEATRA